MAIDLLLVAVLVKSGAVFLAFVAAALLFRASASRNQAGFIKGSVRTGLRITGAVMLFVVILQAWGALRNRTQNKPDDGGDAAQVAVGDNGNINLKFSPRQLTSLAGTIMTLRNSNDSVEVEQAARKLLTVARDGGASREDLLDARGDIVEMLGNDAQPNVVHAVDAALASVVGAPPRAAPPDSVFARYMAAISRNDSVAAGVYRDSVRNALAGADISRLERRASRADARADSLAGELEKAHKARGIRSLIAGIADDVGVGFGWSAVYFTAFLALWRGQTPGKRLAGVRVMLLDGKPLGWWMSFERFGGYAASFSVGLLGFLQILWDRNRQGLHDKACETVVVRVTGAAAPAQPARRF